MLRKSFANNSRHPYIETHAFTATEAMKIAELQMVAAVRRRATKKAQHYSKI
jgi:hypothetical protein